MSNLFKTHVHPGNLNILSERPGRQLKPKVIITQCCGCNLLALIEAQLKRFSRDTLLIIAPGNIHNSDMSLSQGIFHCIQVSKNMRPNSRTAGSPEKIFTLETHCPNGKTYTFSQRHVELVRLPIEK